jgi:hypothetical protein
MRKRQTPLTRDDWLSLSEALNEEIPESLKVRPETILLKSTEIKRKKAK